MGQWIAYAHAVQSSPNARCLFPWTIGFPVLTLAIAQFVLELAGKTRRTVGCEGAIGADLPKEVVYSRTASIIGWILGVLITIWLLGFSLAVPTVSLLYFKITGRENWPTTIIFALISWGFFYGLFEYAVNIPFPQGKLFELFGS